MCWKVKKIRTENVGNYRELELETPEAKEWKLKKMEIRKSKLLKN